MRITVHNRGPESARLHLLPTLWFRNTWSWGVDARKPALRKASTGTVETSHHDLGTYTLVCDGSPELLFTENESNAQRLWAEPNSSPYVKDAFHTYIVAGQCDAVNPANVGTKAAAHYVLDMPSGGTQTVRVRLAAAVGEDSFRDFDQVFTDRIADADEFYARITPRALDDDGRLVQRCSRFLTKPVEAQTLIDAVARAIARDAEERAVRARHSSAKERFNRLTPREREVFAHLISGQLNKQIGFDLGIAERTIKIHRHQVLAKIEAKSIADLVRMAADLGIDPTGAVT